MIRLDDLVDATGGQVLGPRPSGGTFPGFAHDSRNVRGGEAFVAVRTASADGHDHVVAAIAAGASAVIVERLPDGLDPITAGTTTIIVPDVRAALRAWAGIHLARLAPRVVVVTGSAGKTTATAAIAAVLGRLAGDPSTVFENGNRNDLLGLPLALGALEERHRVAVLEVATDHPGEIGALSAIARPEVAVVLGVLPECEPFEGTGAAHAEYLAVVTSATRHLVANLDDAGLAAAISDLSRVPGPRADRGQWPRVFWTGVAPRADARATTVETHAGGLHLMIEVGGEAHRVDVGLHGTHWVPAVLAAVGVAVALGHPPGAAIMALGAVRPVNGRLSPLVGASGTSLLDDTFSATVPSTLMALETLSTRPRPRLVILGDVEGHRPPEPRDVARLGERLAAVADAVVAVGDGADAIARAARAAGLHPERISVAHRATDAVARALATIAAGDPESPVARWTVLLKGGARSRLESIAERLLADPAASPDLLVRQDPGARRVVHAGRDRPAWLEIDLDAITGNLRGLLAAVAPAEVMAVLKADAYGHGAVRVARTVLHHGAVAIATAVLSEAADLRAAGIAAPILVLGHVAPWQAREAARLGVAATLFDDEAARHLSEAAVALGRTIPVHVKVDTGLRRIGLEPGEVVPFARRVAALPGLVIEGLYTHLATADEADATFAHRQLARFMSVLAEWQAAGLRRPRWVHAANSAAALSLPDARLNLVRPGIALFGIAPGPEVPLPPAFRPALQLKTRVAQVKQVATGESVSYGREWVAPSDAMIGVLPIGYGDGMRRGPRTWGEVLVRGRRAPIVGRVCMDMCMIDVSLVPAVRAGDEVVLIGRQGGDAIRAEDVAARAGTTAYEVTTQILARVPREVVVPIDT